MDTTKEVAPKTHSLRITEHAIQNLDNITGYIAKTKNTATVDINRVGGYSGRNSRKFTATVLPQSL